MSIGFSPPDISQDEIDNVIKVLRSGWITTGPMVKQLENDITEYTDSKLSVAFNSATAGLEMVLRLFGIGPGDEVITTAYTYSATCAVIIHVGATPILVDVDKDSFLISPVEIEKKITSRTKAIIPVDVGGYPCNYHEIFSLVEKNNRFIPKKGTLQEDLGRILILSDGAHSIGSVYKGQKIGSVADFTAFSFHAVKNITTAEGGIVTMGANLDSNQVYKSLKTIGLHGQSKDALEKNIAGSWEYDIVTPGYKCNMTDISAALGVSQLQRYKTQLLEKRRDIFKQYHGLLSDSIFINPNEGFRTEGTSSSCHLYLLRLKNLDEDQRNKIIINLAKRGVPTNVHYKPLPMFKAYRDLGFNILDYKNSYNQYKNQITLPLHTLLTEDDVNYIVKNLLEVIL